MSKESVEDELDDRPTLAVDPESHIGGVGAVGIKSSKPFTR